MPSETSAPTPITIRVAGREFRPVAETSFEQDMFVMKILRDAGLSQLADKFNPMEDTLDEFAQDLIVRAFSSGQLFTLLAATLEEIGVPWTMASAEANGLFFSSLRKMEDKEALRGSIVGILMGFLISGVLSSRISQTSSASAALVPHPLHNVVGAPLPSSEDLNVGVLSRTPSGPQSSDSSPDTIPTASP